MNLARISARMLGVLGLSLAVILAWFAVRWGWADWLTKQRTRATSQAAMVLAPDNWGLYEDWSEISPKEAVWALKQAVARNPLNSGLYMELAASEEKAGDFSAAEGDLRRAVELDRTSGPGTVLAGFYFRRKAADRFWAAARSALELTSNPDEELFREGWLLSSDAGFIQRKMIPERADVLLRYMQFLVGENRLDGAKPVAAMVMREPCCGQTVRGLFSDYVDRLAAANRVEEGVGAWNWMSEKGLIPFPRLGLESKTWVTDGGFEVGPAEGSSGFSWRAGSNEGVFVDYLAKEQAMKFTFTGKQAEHCELLAETVVLWPKQRYRLRVKYATLGIGAESGVHWQVIMPSGEDLLTNGTLAGGAEVIGPVEREQKAAFEGPAKASVARLVLAYDRAIGTVRIEGTMEIRKVAGAIE